jgi:hypothetical protein
MNSDLIREDARCADPRLPKPRGDPHVRSPASSDFSRRKRDRISGHAGRVRVLDRFLTYAKSKGDVWFARKDEIARYVLANRAGTPVIDRGSPSKTGLPGPTA